MKKIIHDLTSARREVKTVYQIERGEFAFIKKQHLAYELHDVMKTSGFLEVMYLGHCRENDRMGGCIPYGYHFDAKTNALDYSGVSWGCFLDKEFDEYQSRFDFYEEGESPEFKGLQTLYTTVNHFFEQNPALQPEMVSSWESKVFTQDLTSIMRFVMSESEYSEWLIMTEQEALEGNVSSSLELKPSPPSALDKMKSKKI